jgi:spermidine/putrescine transport system permease protein
VESWRDNARVFLTLAVPGTLWLVLFFLVPLGLMWVMSFGEKTSITGVDITWTFANYIRSFDPLYIGILWKSVYLSILTTAICLVIAYPIAFGICFAPQRWKPLLLLIVVLPFWINLLIRTYALIAVFRTQGYVNLTIGWFLNLFGISFTPWEMLYNNAAVVFGLVYVSLPFMVLPLYATIERLDKAFLEASLDLGASQAQTFLRVTVPLTMPGIISGIILVFIPSLGSFLTPDLLGGANAIMIGNVIERQFKAANDWPFGSAISFLLMYVTFAALALRALLAGRSKGLDV